MATDPTVSVIIPFGGVCGHRRRALAWVLAKLAVHHHDFEITVAVADDHPWRKGVAVAQGVRRSNGDIVIVHDADVWCDGLSDAVDAVAQGAAWSVPHAMLHRLNQEATDQVHAGLHPAETNGRVERPYKGHPGGGIVVLTRDTIDEIPIDPRYEQWGQEDDSWAMALRTLAGEPQRLQHDLWHLWHPPAVRLTRRLGSRTNQRLYRRYRQARRNPDAMRTLVAESQNEEAAWPAP